MSEQPAATIAKEAKGIHQSLKELLNSKGPLDREVDFQRKNLRRQYLSLLLTHPHAKESKDAEMHLWMQTSYAFISAFKQRLLSLERSMQNKASNQAQQGSNPPAQSGRNNSHIVEHRKFLQRFKQFLADEEKFWSQLVVRLQRSFSLDEAKSALSTLGLIPATDDAAQQADTNETAGGNGANGRSHYQFPPDNQSTTFTPNTAEEREAWLSIITKALICLGDIARYRAYYADGGRSKPGQDEGRRGRSRRGGHAAAEVIPRAKNYDKAQQCYEQAALLSPTDGNPYHQLAILATYRKDAFVSVMYHFRALCVRSPYDPALDNMNGILSKALDQWRHRAKRDQEQKDPQPTVQLDMFKEKVLALNALWKIGMEKGIDKIEALTRRRNMDVFNEFAGLVSRRYINTPTIQVTLVIAQGALWKHRMMRPNTNGANGHAERMPPPGTSTIIEWSILEHLLNIFRALLDVGSEELKVPPPSDVPSDDLGQRITAPFRRMLPSLRVASKWLRANLAYLMQDHEFDAYQATKANNGTEVPRNSNCRISKYSTVTKQFWNAYTEFMSSLSVAFPSGRLPAITVQLDEDTEMRGFLPLRNMIGEVRKNTEDGVNRHPNDWQLMRIADLLKDGQELTAAPNSPVFESYGIYNIRQGIFEPRHTNTPSTNGGPFATVQQVTPGAAPAPSLPDAPEDDNMTDSTSRTEDDILNEAFQFLHAPGGNNDEDEEPDDEQIVWNPRASLSPTLSSNLPSPPQLTPVVNTVPLRSPPTTVHQLSPTHSQTLSPFARPATIVPSASAPTTAQDLLNDVLSGRTGRPRPEASAPVAPPLFSDLNHLSGGHNIWSAAQDEQSLTFAAQPNQSYRQRQHQTMSASMNLSQSSWTSSYPTSTQDSHRNLPASLPPIPFAPHSPSSRGAHQRVPSANFAGVGPQHLSPSSHRLGALDPLVYSSASPQRQPQQPDLYGLNGHSPYMGSPLGSTNPAPNGFYANTQFAGYPNNVPTTSSQSFGAPMSNVHQHVWGNVR